MADENQDQNKKEEQGMKQTGVSAGSSFAGVITPEKAQELGIIP